MQRYLWVLVVVVCAAVIGPQYLQSRLQKLVEVHEVEEPEPARTSSKRPIRIRSASDGHFWTSIRINNRNVKALIDTGATLLAIPESVARRSGIPIRNESYTTEMRTANGISTAAPVSISNLRVGSIRLRNVKGVVVRDESLSIVLVGMSVLNRLGTIAIKANELVITPR